MKKIYYEKVGRKYVPVSEYDSDLLDAVPKGTHIIMSYPGGKSTRYNINPAFAPMIAAGRYAEDAVRRAILMESIGRPKSKPITKRQRAAWDEIQAAFGDEFWSIQYPSTHDIAEAGVQAMQEEADKLLTNPAVKLAYDHFIMICQLTAQQKDVV